MPVTTGSFVALDGNGASFELQKYAPGSAADTGSAPVAFSTEGKAQLASMITSLAAIAASLDDIEAVAESSTPSAVAIDQTGTNATVNIAPSLRINTPSPSSVARSTSSVSILAANASRKASSVLNDDAEALWLNLAGGTASSTARHLRVGPAETVILPAFANEITGYWENSGTGSARVVDWS